MLRIILLGAPGVGKGTQATYLCRQYNIPHISTGDMLRDELRQRTDIGQRAKAIMERGDLVPDDIVVGLVNRRVAHGCPRGFLLDGFPRSLPQAETLSAMGLAVDHVIEIQVENAVIVERLSQRRLHPASGRVYHLTHNPPACAGVDDETGEVLVQRVDDKAETVAERLRVYDRQTRPLSEYYQALAQRSELKYMAVNGDDAPEGVRDTIQAHLQVAGAGEET